MECSTATVQLRDAVWTYAVPLVLLQCTSEMWAGRNSSNDVGKRDGKRRGV